MPPPKCEKIDFKNFKQTCPAQMAVAFSSLKDSPPGRIALQRYVESDLSAVFGAGPRCSIPFFSADRHEVSRSASASKADIGFQSPHVRFGPKATTTNAVEDFCALARQRKKLDTDRLAEGVRLGSNGL
jgi:hypothetical protein